MEIEQDHNKLKNADELVAGTSKETYGKTDVNKSEEAVIIQKSSALSLLAQYSESDSEEETEKNNENYRKAKSSSSSSSSSESDNETDIRKIIEKKLSAPVGSDDESDEENPNKTKKREPLKVKGEFGIDDLPPIQDLQISVDERECVQLGSISSIVDQLVLIETFPNSIPLDIDSVLFLDNGKQALGKVFDVIGPVHGPIYCVRFNSHDDIIAKGITVGTKVFCAPRTEYSSFVILSQVMAMKGSDASWKNDIEPPDNLIDYSDDEQEKKIKRQGKNYRQQNPEERRQFLKGRRHLPNNNPPNLAYPNYSWHQNLPPNLMNQNQNQRFYQQ
ncbi:CLUMA_CG001850, isoform A [Clunio marinus]|uniref:H/ACA ribonucleoprotein complex subunit n=1 Tax=Clunio marinus TaxID=568069 RepID=A0A1J1HPC7_9DIPT|nr:CLUMA_CG001850, isoform A [Clunio marinus]